MVINRNRLRFVRALIEVVGLVIWVEVALRRHSFEQVLSGIGPTGRRAWHGREISPSTFERAIAIAYRILPLEPTCLKHSLIFCRIRRRRGLAAELRIGVQKDEGIFMAHAWLEDEAGQPLTDPMDKFVPFPLVCRGAGRHT